MEFEKINLEKSWNFVSDLKHCETNFSRASRAFQVSIILVIHGFIQDMQSITLINFYPVINQYIINVLIHIHSVLVSWKKWKHFWKNHGKFMEFDSGFRLETLFLGNLVGVGTSLRLGLHMNKKIKMFIYFDICPIPKIKFAFTHIIPCMLQRCYHPHGRTWKLLCEL